MTIYVHLFNVILILNVPHAVSLAVRIIVVRIL